MNDDGIYNLFRELFAKYSPDDVRRIAARDGYCLEACEVCQGNDGIEPCPYKEEQVKGRTVYASARIRQVEGALVGDDGKPIHGLVGLLAVFDTPDEARDFDESARVIEFYFEEEA